MLTSKGKPLATVTLSCWHINSSPLSLAPIAETSGYGLKCLDVSRTQVSSQALVNILHF